MNYSVINASETHYLRPCSWNKHNESRNRSSLTPEGPAHRAWCALRPACSPAGTLSRTHERHSLDAGTDTRRAPPLAALRLPPQSGWHHHGGPWQPTAAHGGPRRPHDPLRDMPTFRVPPLEPSLPLSGGGRRPRPIAELRSPRVGEGSPGRRDAGPASSPLEGAAHTRGLTVTCTGQSCISHTRRGRQWDLLQDPRRRSQEPGAAPGHSRGIVGAQQSGPKPHPARPHGRLHTQVSRVPWASSGTLSGA